MAADRKQGMTLEEVQKLLEKVSHPNYVDDLGHDSFAGNLAMDI